MKASKDYIFFLLDEMEREDYTPPSSYYMRDDVFMYQSHRHWAIKEIKLYFEERIDQDPLYLIENFRRMVDYYSCKTKVKELDIMYSVAYDVATDVLDVLINK